jgi:predicted RNA-binding protein with PUA-like domain
VVGLASVVREAYPDPKGKNERLVVVDVEPRRRLARPLTLAGIRGMAEFAESPLVRQGRLSVVPITEAQWRAVESRGAR